MTVTKYREGIRVREREGESNSGNRWWYKLAVAKAVVYQVIMVVWRVNGSCNKNLFLFWVLWSY